MRYESSSMVQDAINNIVIAPLSGRTDIELATKIAERVLGLEDIDLTDRFMDPHKFSVGEFCPKFRKEAARNKSVYIPLFPSPYQSPGELVNRACMIACAAKENGATKVVLLATDLPYARQDRGPQEDHKALGELNSVRFHARIFAAAGIDQVITTHAHSPKIAALYALEFGLVHKLCPELLPEEARALPPKYIVIPGHLKLDDDLILDELRKVGESVFKDISPHCILADYILHQSSLASSEYLKNGGSRLVLKSMDKGNRTFIDNLFKALYLNDANRLYCDKQRTKKNDPSSVEVRVIEAKGNFSSLNGMLEIYADDGLDTGGTMMRAVQWSNDGNRCAETGREYGKPKERFIYFTHAWLGGEDHMQVQRTIAEKIPTKEFVTTNTRPYINEAQYYRMKKKTTVLRLADLWGDAILAHELGNDVGTRYTHFSSEAQQHEFLADQYILKRHTRHFLSQSHTTAKDVQFALRE